MAKRAGHRPAAKNKKSSRSVAGRRRAVEYLAERLFFELERDGDLYSIYRKIGGFTPDTISPSMRLRRYWSCGSYRGLTLMASGRHRHRRDFHFKRYEPSTKSLVDRTSVGHIWLC